MSKASEDSFPYASVTLGVIATWAFGGRGLLALHSGELRVPFMQTVLTAGADPTWFYVVAIGLVILGLLCVLGLVDAVLSWRRRGGV